MAGGEERLALRQQAAAVTRAGPLGSGASSAIAVNGSAITTPFLTSGIGAVLEGFDAEALHGGDEGLFGAGAQFQIGIEMRSTTSTTSDSGTAGPSNSPSLALWLALPPRVIW